MLCCKECGDEIESGFYCDDCLDDNDDFSSSREDIRTEDDVRMMRGEQ